MNYKKILFYLFIGLFIFVGFTQARYKYFIDDRPDAVAVGGGGDGSSFDGQATTPWYMNGFEFFLDADSDSSISAAIDDEILLKTGGDNTRVKITDTSIDLNNTTNLDGDLSFVGPQTITTSSGDLTFDASGNTINNDLTKFCNGVCPSFQASINSGGDVGIEERLEVLGYILANSNAFLNTGIVWDFNGYSRYGGITKIANNGVAYLVGGVTSLGNRNFIITDYSYFSTNHVATTSLSPNPTLWGYSLAPPSGSGTNFWWNITHDQTYAVYDTGTEFSFESIMNVGDGVYSWTNCDAPGSVCVEGELEVDGQARFETTTTFVGWASTSGNGILMTGAVGTGTSIADFSDDGLHFSIGTADGGENHHLIFTSGDNWNKDHGHDTKSTNPKIWLHSVRDPTGDGASDWMSFEHDQTDGVIDVGTGDIKLDDDVHITGNLTVDGFATQSPTVGEMYAATPSAITINTQNVWEHVDGLTDGVNNNITCDGSSFTVVQNGTYLIMSSASSTASLTNDIFEYSISVNDTIQDKCTQQRKFSTTDVGAVPVSCLLVLTEGDGVKYETRNTVSSNNITFQKMNIIIRLQ
jgi:hypothetical protein